MEKDIALLIFITCIIGLSVLAVVLALRVRNGKKIKGKYIIIHYIDVGNLDDEISQDRIKQLESASDILDQNFSLDKNNILDVSPAELHVMKYKTNNALTNKYDDVAEELFIQVRNGGTRMEVIDFNKPKSFIKVVGSP